MAPAVLGYWDIRGIAQPIRLLLEYTGTPYEDKFFTCGPPPDYDTKEWHENTKFKIGLDFPNLPYYIDGKVKLTHSKAILRYIARKHDLVGKTEEEKTRLDLAGEELEEVRAAVAKLAYDQDFEKLKEPYLKELPARLKRFSDFLGTNTWFAGDNLTYVDFCIYETLDVHRNLEPNCLKGMKNLEDFQARVAKLDKVAAYLASPRYEKVKIRLNANMAKFGGGE